MAIPVIILIIALAVFIAGNREERIQVVAVHPAVGRIVESIPASGKIRPVTEVTISPDVSGEIVSLQFEEGDPVRKGDLILKIRQDVYLSSRDRAEASLNSVKAQYLQQLARLEQAGLDYRRNEKLFEKKAISASEHEVARSEYRVAQRQLESAGYNVRSAMASMREAEENLSKTLIYAPMDGVISSLMVEKGERVVGTSQMAGTEMLRIADFDRMEVLVHVNEIDILKVHPGDTAFVEVDAYPQRRFLGVVTHLANSAGNISYASDQVTAFKVKVLLLIDSYRDLMQQTVFPFRPGMTASVQIKTSSKDGILTVPIQAVTTREDLSGTGKRNEAAQYVFVVDPLSSRVHARQIETGIQDIYDIEVTDGLSAEELIVISPFSAIDERLRPGDIVEYRTENLKKSDDSDKYFID